jgi:hypothetical protein
MSKVDNSLDYIFSDRILKSNVFKKIDYDSNLDETNNGVKHVFDDVLTNTSDQSLLNNSYNR